MSDPREPVIAVVGAGCQLCGAPVPEVAVTWMVQTTPRGPAWTCPACARTNLRAIEANLDQEYW